MERDGITGIKRRGREDDWTAKIYIDGSGRRRDYEEWTRWIWTSQSQTFKTLISLKWLVSANINRMTFVDFDIYH